MALPTYELASIRAHIICLPFLFVKCDPRDLVERLSTRNGPHDIASLGGGGGVIISKKMRYDLCTRTMQISETFHQRSCLELIMMCQKMNNNCNLTCKTVY